MHKEALVLGLLFLFVSFILTFALTKMSASYVNLPPLAIMALILLVIGTVVTVYSIWDEVTGRSSPSTKSSQHGAL